jgi:hypothetical protein
MLQRVRADGTPNINALWTLTKDLEALKADVKSIVYDLGRDLERNLEDRTVAEPVDAGLTSKPCTQADIESAWGLYWSGRLNQASRYHRAAWEVRFVLQGLQEAGLAPGWRVLTLGGVSPVEPMLTALGAVVSQMNDAPASGDFDACISCAEAGHQGSIAAGSAFLVNSVKALRLGGIAAHTFDFNVAEDEQTLDNWPAVLFRRRDIEAVAEALELRGQAVAPLSFDLGAQALDRFIDLPPFAAEGSQAQQAQWSALTQRVHLKASIDGFATTSYGLIVRRRV